MEDPRTEEMRISQAEREREESERARTAEEEEETATHARRADRAAYLREKLEQRAKSERANRRRRDG